MSREHKIMALITLAAFALVTAVYWAIGGFSNIDRSDRPLDVPRLMAICANHGFTTEQCQFLAKAAWAPSVYGLEKKR